MLAVIRVNQRSLRVDLAGAERLRSLVRLLYKDDAVSTLLRSCNEVGEAFLFGGAPRDALFGVEGVFGDIDIFVSGPLDTELAHELSRFSRRTNFGGMRLVVGKFDVDIWELPQSHAFRIEKGRSVSIPNLLDSVCFSTDGIAVSLLDGRVLATHIFQRTLRDRALRFVSPPLEFNILYAVRVARLIYRLRTWPDQEVARFFLDAADRSGVEGIVEAEGRWRGRRVLDSAICKRIVEVCSESVAGGAAPEGSAELLLPSDILADHGLNLM